MTTLDQLKQEYEDLMKQERLAAARIVLAERDRLLQKGGPTDDD